MSGTESEKRNFLLLVNNTTLVLAAVDAGCTITAALVSLDDFGAHLSFFVVLVLKWVVVPR